MDGNPKDTQAVDGALHIDPGILLVASAPEMPGISGEFSFSPYTAAAYFIPAVLVLVFGLDWMVFAVCIACEVIFFAWSRVIQMWYMPGGIAAAKATLFMLVPLAFFSFLLLCLVLMLLLGHYSDENGMHEIGRATRIAGFVAMGSLAADAVRRFRRVTLPRIRFMQWISDRYMFDGEPQHKLFPASQTIMENVALLLFGGLIAGLYFGTALTVMAVTAWILRFLVSEQRASATGAVIGFGLVRYAVDFLRTGTSGLLVGGAQVRTLGELLERVATVTGKRVVLRRPAPGSKDS